MGSKIGARALHAGRGRPDRARRHAARSIRRGRARRRAGPGLSGAREGLGGRRRQGHAHRHGRTARPWRRSRAARREAAAAFGDGTLYVERLIERPRHVEIQIFADAHGNVVHLFERECSVQRRHQKVIEESPSPASPPSVRRRMGDAAVAAARAAGYRNAGTIEFLVEGEGEHAQFYFLEMNTGSRSSIPVTEAVAGVDLVRAQFIVADGGRLPWTQDTLVAARPCASSAESTPRIPRTGFFRRPGRFASIASPPGRASESIPASPRATASASTTIRSSPSSSCMPRRARPRDRARSARLRSYPVLGTRTNIPFLLRLLELPAFRAGQAAHRHDRGAHAPGRAHAPDEVPAEALVAAAFAAAPAAAPDQTGRRRLTATPGRHSAAGDDSDMPSRTITLVPADDDRTHAVEVIDAAMAAGCEPRWRASRAACSTRWRVDGDGPLRITSEDESDDDGVDRGRR